MSDPTPGRPTESRKRKSPPMVAEEKETPRAPKRIKLCLKRGGSADVAKATASIVEPVGPGDQSSAATHEFAVKKFRLSGGDVIERGRAAAFVNELSLLSELDHDNIVELIGFVENVEEEIAWILLQWEENGNLREFIHSQEWVIPERVALIYNVACGLHYLHSRDPPICHGDLKSLNILVNSQSRAVITDFRSARKLETHPRRQGESNVGGSAPSNEPTLSQVQERSLPLIQIEECGTFLTLTGPVYTLRWAAPEVLRDEEFSLASDMWAFAWICWESPFNDLRKDTEIILSVARGDLPPVTSNEHTSQVRVLCVMMARCWRMDATTRPTARDCESSIRFLDQIAPTRRQRASELEIYSAEVLCVIAYTKYENGQYKEAKEYFDRAIKVAHSAGDVMAVANAMVGQGIACRELMEYAEAEVSYTKAKEIYARQGAELKVAQAHWELGEVHRLRNEYAKAEASHTEAKEISARLGAERDVAEALWGLGKVYWNQNEYSKAKASYTEAKEIYARLGFEGQAAYAISGLGEVYRDRKEYSKAEASHTEAKEIYARLGAEKRVAGAACGLADVYLWWGEYSKAEASFTEAREIYARLGAEHQVALATSGLGDVYRLQDEYSKSEASYLEAREIYARLGAESSAAYAIWGLGCVYLLRDEYSKAEASHNEARDIYTRLGDEKGVGDAIWGLGEVYRLREEYPKAEAALIEAREIFTKIGWQQGLEAALSSLTKLSEAQGRSTGSDDSLSEASLEAEDEAYTRLRSSS
ncbi:hypothetical protein FRC04_009862 [Tulasnella sp. 424]|nr:hypothetical protein FRC04_009862 [Tulasnella sp. 424]